MKLTSILLVLLPSIILFSGCSSNNSSENNVDYGTAYYGDYDSNKVFAIDLQEMKVKTIINTEDGPYGVDLQKKGYAYALTRKVTSMDIIDTKKLVNIGLIDLPFTPRSTDYESQKQNSLVSSKSDPMSCLIDVNHHEVTQCVGHFHDGSEMTDFGGGNSTGHPLFADKDHFFMLNRVNKTIEYYNLDGELLSFLSTVTTVHHLLFDGESYFGVLEGSKEFNPGLVRFKITNDKLVIDGVINLYGDPLVMGGHHADWHPDGKHIYMGSYEGNLFVIDSTNMTIIDTVKAGIGVGHVTFIPGRQLAITTNHYDSFMSVFDVSNPTNNKLVKEIIITEIDGSGARLQSHTSGVSLDEKYFYTAASHDGDFLEIDLDKLEISRVLHLGGNILMGDFEL